MNNEKHGIQRKLGMLKLAEKLGNVSEASKTFVYSRDFFYRIRNLYETGGTEALKEVSISRVIIPVTCGELCRTT
jgi:hypothetical protein